jgi:hypothetical protein
MMSGDMGPAEMVEAANEVDCECRLLFKCCLFFQHFLQKSNNLRKLLITFQKKINSMVNNQKNSLV